MRARIENADSINLMDINIHSENFYRDFLNLLLDLDLKNINIVEKNAAAIDLGDEIKKIALQVTATGDLKKTKDTVKKFNEKDLNKKYDRLIILNITSKKSHREPLVGDSGKYQLDTKKDIWDLKNILEKINDLTTDKIEKIKLFLEKEVKIESQETLPKEVSTFLDLIEVLSDENKPSAGKGEYLENPDPKGKIEKRFVSHASFLKGEYQNLYSEYGVVLQEVLESSDIGQPRIRRLALHLRDFSDQTLDKSNGDAKAALNHLVKHYSDILSSKGLQFDENAIRFYLVYQLIQCNVFPNKVAA